MILNLHVMQRWVDEVRPRLQGARILDVFSQAKDMLHVSVITHDRRQEVIELSCVARHGHLVLRASHHKRRKNTSPLFPDILGLKISDVNMKPDDRVVVMPLSNGHHFVLVLYGGMNAFHSDAHDVVLDAFQDARELTGQVISNRGVQLRKVTMTTEDAFISALPTGADVKEFLVRGGQHLSKPLVQEILMEWVSDDPRDAFAVMTGLFGRMRSELPVIYTNHGCPMLLSPCRLKALELRNPQWQVESFSSINETIEHYLNRRHAFDRREALKADILRVCRNRIKKNQALLKALADDRADAMDYEQTERKGQLLSANLFRIHKGMDRIQIESWFDDAENPVEVSLNPELTPAENVKVLFARAKKQKNSVRKLEVRSSEVEREVKQLDLIMNEVQLPGTELKRIEQIRAEFIRKGWIQERVAVKKKEPAEFNFREFRVTGNWRVFVGQNDQKNDELTFRFARADDYWFHARGVPGSHVVLKRDGRKDNPGKAALEETASVAAFYSKARTSGLVPVSWTLKKFVRKSKGARPGQVVLEREEVLVVPPTEPPSPTPADDSTDLD